MTPKVPIVSIIIPCYNCDKYIAETLECLQKQTVSNWEAIIVNDGSTDKSSEIAKKYALEDARYKVIDQENSGPAVARNNGIRASRGKYILPLDADDLIDPTYVEKSVDYLESHPNVKLVYCEACFFGDYEGKWELPDYKWDRFIWNNCIFSSSVFRRSDYDSTSGYNSNMRMVEEDWDFYLSLLRKNDEVYRIPEILFFYRQHGKSRTNHEDHVLMRARIQMIINHPDIYTCNIEETTKWLGVREQFYKNKCKELNDTLNVITHSKSFDVARRLASCIQRLKKFINI